MYSTKHYSLLTFLLLTTMLLSLIPFSPYFSYIIVLMVLIFFSGLNKNILFVYFFVGMLSQFFIVHSRNYVIEKEFDLMAYYDAYQLLLLNKDISFLDFGNEFGWFLLYGILSKFNLNLSVYELAFINTFICLTLFAVWLYLYGSKDILNQNMGFALATVLLFLWQPNFSFFQRQAISVVILLFAISNLFHKKKFILFLILSSIFHFSSMVVGLLYFFIVRLERWRVFKLLIILLCIRLFSPYILDYLSGFEIVEISKKANFYIDKKIFYFAFSEWRFLPLFVLALLFNKNIPMLWRRLIIFSTIFYLSLLGIQFAPGRMNFILFYLYGYFLFLVCSSGKQYKVLLCYVILYLVFDLVYKSGLFFNISDQYWQRYPIFNVIPFYYF